MTDTATALTTREQLEKAVITALYYYPIKGCRGIAINEAEVTRRGLKHDRELTLIQASDGEFLTQREVPRLALVTAYLDDYSLRVSAPGMPDLEVPVRRQGERVNMRVWRDHCEAIDQGAEVAEWFSQYLGQACQLVRMAEDFTRRLNPDYARREDDQVNFADGYPCLLASEEGLADLNRRLAEPLPMNRFRPNIVISGSEIAWAEDLLDQVRLGEVTLDVVKPCARCVVTTTNQETAEVGKEPLKTLATFRRGANGGVMFGQNLIPATTGRLKVGDRLEVIELK